MIIKYIKWEMMGLVELVAIRLRSILFRHNPPAFLRMVRAKAPSIHQIIPTNFQKG
jgi:hypothetical protein